MLARMARMNVFTKMTLLILLFLIPVLLLYTYSNQESVDIIEHEIQSSTTNRLSTFAESVESNIDQLSLYGISIGQDSSIQEFQLPDNQTAYEQVRLSGAILEKMNLYNAVSKWHSTLTLYFPRLQQVISTDYYSTIPYEETEFSEPFPQNWIYDDVANTFIWHTTEPTTAMDNPARARLITKVSFPAHQLVVLLDQNKQHNSGDPFLFHADSGVISNSTANWDLMGELENRLRQTSLQERGGFRAQLKETEYYVSYIRSQSLDWYYVDYVPMQQILSPVTSSRNLFYLSIGVLLAMSIVIIFAIYRSVQLPLLQLIKGTKRLSDGDFSTRLDDTKHNEFSQLFFRFNIMAQRIQELIENVYEEKLRRREATLKQLQSQINPHFLYNCLFYIKNMARMKNEEAVVAMSLNLGEYYRYITRSENDLATIREELNMATNYLKIQALRLERMHFTVDIPADILEQSVPRLTLQPIIENAIVHGLEPTGEHGEIIIRGVSEDGYYNIIVEDSGMGMTDEKLEQIRQDLTKPLTGHIGCGTWNIHQRLSFQFGEGSGLTFNHSPLGGVQVEIKWRHQSDGER
ncbi:sensor histidine kinase YesM [Paenibacillus antibioticophila]|uniref:Sensor histidine kinase YesM n=1 Tax=Paenibacillus antibioticophila TaxID=1274374 RepID=A0A919XTI7_9BACL|nr:sensor histidine kinase [Paenibacillus antibioticophila]GIO37709.1 sensor histidine kinase YesM [Paenibacillus antibioticophila]